MVRTMPGWTHVRPGESYQETVFREAITPERGNSTPAVLDFAFAPRRVAGQGG